jgi:hypothetical protein
MNEIVFQSRRAVRLENDQIRVTLTIEGGHIAEILDKRTGVNPLWQPPWTSIEPTLWSPDRFPEYGDDNESKLLAGIMGHNLCLDLFGPPSESERAAGIFVHGEANLIPWEWTGAAGSITTSCILPASQLRFVRTLRLEGRRLLIQESVENLSRLDRPIAWTQHVTLGPPFLEDGKTQFRLPGTKSRGIGESTDFDWPGHPQPGGRARDLRVFAAEPSSHFTTHLLDHAQSRAWFTAWSPGAGVALAYVWRRADFPWIGIWEENCLREHKPWQRRAKTRGMEFGVSPFPEPRRQMLDRGSLFGEAAYRWVPARSTISAQYYAAVVPAAAVPESLEAFEALL